MGDAAYDLLGLLYRAAFQCWQHDFEGSLTLAWAVIEKAQNVLWDQFLTTGYQTVNPNTKISGKRRDLLKGNRDYTASVRSQVLSLARIYSDSELNQIDEVRRKRNASMHNLEAIAPKEAMNAANCAVLVVGKVLDAQFWFSPTFGSWDTK